MCSKIYSVKSSILAGVMISIGATVYLSAPNKIIGSVMFSIALFAICTFNLSLFTGKVGYVIDNKNYADLLVTWLCNLIGVIISTFPIRFAKPELIEVSRSVIEPKLNQSYLSTLILGVMCGILMFIAVDNYKKNNSYVGIFLCVPVFVMCGFEHSIADMSLFLFGINSVGEILKTTMFILCVTVANSIGSLLFRNLSSTKENV